MNEIGEVLTDDEDFLDVVDAVLHPRMERQFRERTDHFLKWRNNEFLQRFRLSKNTVEWIVDAVAPRISNNRRRNHALTASEMVLLTMRFLATGCFLQAAGDFSGVDKSTASRIIHRVTREIASMSAAFIKMPHEDINEVCQKFFNISRFPRCIGALDCTHIKIQSSGGEEPENYRNRKGYFSFNVQAVCDADLKIRDVVCRWPGSAHDSNIFRNSSLRARFENEEFGDKLLLGDSGYGIKPYLMTPLNNPTTIAENRYNEAHIRTRNTIERCFGVLKRRFPILPLGIRLKAQKVEAIVVCCTVLHNIACQRRDELPLVEEDNIPAIPVDGHLNNIGGINNVVRHILISEYFERLH